MSTRRTYQPLLILVMIIIFAGCIVPVIAQTNDSQNASPLPTITSDNQLSIELNFYSFLIVISLILLLGCLFILFLYYSNRLEQTSYLGTLYHEIFEDIEYKAFSDKINSKFAREEYHEEVWKDETWLAENTHPGEPPEKTDPKYQDYVKKLNEWNEKYLNEINRRYKKDLKCAQKKAAERAEIAIKSPDYLALRGKGPEFVLEWTTIIVIVFAAVILGVIGGLGAEQIGTLLAAIAGYILGRATSRTKEGVTTTAPPSTEEIIKLIGAVRGTAPTSLEGKPAPDGKVTYTVTAKSGAGGSIDPSGTIEVPAGSSKTFTVKPSEGFIIEGIKVNGSSVEADEKVTIDDIRKNYEIEATFRKFSQ